MRKGGTFLKRGVSPPRRKRLLKKQALERYSSVKNLILITVSNRDTTGDLRLQKSSDYSD
jgi:hypothetical protein